MNNVSEGVNTFPERVGARCCPLTWDAVIECLCAMAPNIGSLELVKAGIKKNVNNSNKCRKPFTNEAKRPF